MEISKFLKSWFIKFPQGSNLQIILSFVNPRLKTRFIRKRVFIKIQCPSKSKSWKPLFNGRVGNFIEHNSLGLNKLTSYFLDKIKEPVLSMMNHCITICVKCSTWTKPYFVVIETIIRLKSELECSSI